MPRTFPTQIIVYLQSNFGTPQDFDVAVIRSYVGSVSGFLELYDALPQELIRLSPEDYATLVRTIATVRYSLDQYRSGNNADCLRPVGRALAHAWQMIAKLRDEAPSTGHDLSFIADPDLREMIGLDISAIATDLQSGEWKGATVLAGSCCEALLLYALQYHEIKSASSVKSAVKAINWPGKKPNPNDLTDRSWDLFSYMEVTYHLRLISRLTKDELNPTREYRNLIHPAKTVRERVKCDRGTAFVGAGALEHVLSDLRQNL